MHCDQTDRQIHNGVIKGFCFSRRKWLPPPLRKLSQGKVDKTQAAPPPPPPPLKKTGSDKRIKVGVDHADDDDIVFFSLVDEEVVAAVCVREVPSSGILKEQVRSLPPTVSSWV
ncbi:hypothetical protein NQ317_012956 [Molorchus minor]|uniref:Uncharacterized protein n=1 Tax=Molorchus minor TaxID=1323400 RepID=A0ABQ9IXW7_9CUCU|nr:hypothetical protein NQ317_012956 [Molorchus minor]